MAEVASYWPPTMFECAYAELRVDKSGLSRLSSRISVSTVQGLALSSVTHFSGKTTRLSDSTPYRSSNDHLEPTASCSAFARNSPARWRTTAETAGLSREPD